MTIPPRCRSTFADPESGRPIECTRREGHPADGADLFAYHASQDCGWVWTDDDVGVSLRPESPFGDQGVLQHRDIEYGPA